MTYSIDVDIQAQKAIAALPADGLIEFAELLAVLELVPWNGRSINSKRNPDAPVRTMPFGGSGMVTYLIAEEQQRVDILLIAWVG